PRWTSTATGRRARPPSRGRRSPGPGPTTTTPASRPWPTPNSGTTRGRTWPSRASTWYPWTPSAGCPRCSPSPPLARRARGHHRADFAHQVARHEQPHLAGARPQDDVLGGDALDHFGVREDVQQG